MKTQTDTAPFRAGGSFGICNLSIVPCRKEPSDKSEMVTQLLFGEHFEVLEEKKSWTLIRIAYDDYECWIDKKQFLPMNDIKGISDLNTAVTTDIVQLASPQPSPKEREQIQIPIVLGSSLPKYKDKEFFLGKEKYSFEGEVTFPFANERETRHSRLAGWSKAPDAKLQKKVLPNGDNLERTAKWYLGSPYLWGGRSPFGLDCSGFTQMVFKLNGIKLKRDAWQQAEVGKTLSFLEESKTGDLAFFDNEEGKIIHVGIITSPPSPLQLETGARGEVKIIHASGKVRIDKLDHHGIYNEGTKKYSHRLRVIKRFV